MERDFWEGVAGMAGMVRFRVRAAALTEYAAAVRGEAGRLAGVGREVGGVGVGADWFGRMPQSGKLAAGYEGHHEAVVAGVAEVVAGLIGVAEALERTAGRYSGADRKVVEAAGRVGRRGP